MTSQPINTIASAYQHSPLDYMIGGQIRVLVVDEGENNAPITGSLQVTTVLPECTTTEAPVLEWDAISYSWEGQSLSEDTRIDGRPLKVTKNGSNLINELRHRAHKRVLWIDAVCINQGDNEEKSNQVPQMREIYQRAHSVIIWLPAHGDDARTVTALVATE
jgi:hypothetical protein